MGLPVPGLGGLWLGCREGGEWNGRALLYPGAPWLADGWDAPLYSDGRPPGPRPRFYLFVDDRLVGPLLDFQGPYRLDETMSGLFHVRLEPVGFRLYSTEGMTTGYSRTVPGGTLSSVFLDGVYLGRVRSEGPWRPAAGRRLRVSVRTTIWEDPPARGH